jgi:16S rRNA (adenine1518-N6/adenine1519-N6)-dimethyltransferase
MSLVKPKKGLGQHFLKDLNIARKIVGSIESYSISKVLEIGPGTGVLTQFLLSNKNFETYCIEIDRESIAYLKSKFPELGNRLMEGDFLKTDLTGIFSKQLIIMGNFPYNISSQIFFRVLDYKDLVSEVVCMVQKEVADRICAASGNKTYGILSVLLQAYYHTTNLFTVNPSVFVPPPKVKSAVMRLTRNNRKDLDCDPQLFRQVVKTGFNQRRKVLRNSLKNLLSGVDPNETILQMRPEQLSVDQFIGLTRMIGQAKTKLEE